MMVQATEDIGEDSAAPFDSHSTPIISQPSSSKPQKKKSRRKKRKDSAPTEPTTEETPDEAYVSTPSYDPPQNGVDSMQLSELMNLCTSLQEKVLNLEKAKTAQAKEILLKRREVKLLEKQKEFKSQVNSKQHQASQLPQAKDKGKGIMVEPEVPLKKKDQIAMDKEVARNLEAQLQAELEEEERLARKKEEEANIALLESRKRKKHFASLRAQEKRSKPPTKAQKRNTMCTYLKNMAGYKHNQLKSKSYDEIQEMFDKEMKRVNTFVDMNSELVKGSKTKAEGSSKRAGDELEQEKAKKQKGDDDQEEEEMKTYIEIVDPYRFEVIYKDGHGDAALNPFKSTNKERYEHVDPKVTSSQDGKVYKMAKRDYDWLVVGLKRLQDILRVTAAQLQLLSDYYCWKEYADRDEIKD
ncbi:hypothetical protein Tco_1228868 [Tanacetum coccineum]